MANTAEILFFHGKESKPWGRKSLHLREHFEVEAPDFQDMDIWERLDKAEAITEGSTDLVVVGSSYGGLLSALLYSRHPERFGGYVLLAPALHLPAAEEIESTPDNAVVLHGVHDDVVPIDAVRRFCTRFELELEEVDDGHRLAESLDEMVDRVWRVMGDKT